MSISSSFTDFSLAELFQLIDQGRKSGCLTVCTLPDIHIPGSKSHYYYIWFRLGCIVAAANHLNGQGLSYKMTQRGWVNQQIIEEVWTQTAATLPLGSLLKTQGILSIEQLNSLFASQLHQIRELFEIQKGVFKLDTKANLPLQEMTGLSLRTLEVALMAVRGLKNWNMLAEVLPDVSSGIRSKTDDKPQIHLNTLEWQVWELADGSISLSAIASQLNQPITIVQQAAFRLMLVGLVEEVSVAEFIVNKTNDPMNSNSDNSSVFGFKKSKNSETFKISTSFLQNLVGFLKT
ncbi:MAG: DUF4388 domain-containing protein [Brasilonema octagenarum HA4186-MV1]|jgi:ribulose bisphosphate carboxylase small subunit|uniref:PatA-like N-terminal domain-containing protein n=2 Tax=Brasilonema TaxID=383614 RepID=A0A856M7G0_9CYAN|nr:MULTISPECIES: DUF4388 domain-containing protein [Brasilonema]MBW4630086.1 DUF4388 domain-containing protein [Brasilonema octagenarum HA4186-MV1]NMF64706.1 hypothetical protein [Brasilonema octagenarum UFV-OR1]QDL07075.1 hypothetical protein DP114_03370 [Brasilonema sennae CENA114]QDL13439.1 hypothetical protein DP113_03325 [Brasilonema octagenarum UFV-E1]